MKVLVVEDNEDSRKLLMKQLRVRAHEVMTAVNGAEALKQALTQPPDIIVSDIMMPKMDGFQLCRECKGDEKLKDIPFVIYTATYKDEQDEKLALKLGADKFLIKPMEADELIKTIQGVLEDVKRRKVAVKKPVLEEEKEVLELYSKRLVAKLEKKMLNLEAETTARKQSEERLEHLNRVLYAIRSVDQLIVKGKDRQRLLKGTCNNLTKAGYYNAWIALLDESGRLVTTAEAGVGEDFLPMVEQLKHGELVTCARQALVQAGVVVIKDPALTCSDCPLAKKYRGRGGIATRLEHDERVYGLLVTSVPAEFTADEEEQSLLREVSGDIAFALHDIELEEKRKRLEHNLNERVKELQCLYGIADIAERQAITLDELYRETVKLLPLAWLYPKITCARITIGDKEFKTENYSESPWKQSSDIKIDGTKAGSVEVCYLEERPEIDEGPFLKEERLLIGVVADRLGQITERKQAEELLEKSLNGTIQAIGQTTEMRDRYTASHQRRVTQLACVIAKEMDLPQHQIEGIRVAGLMHDIGKMSIPAEILSKPSKLTDTEFALIKGHSQAAYDILKNIEFPWPIADIVLQHHERLDGSGYPNGLKGDEIKIEARIIAVADVVDAMVSHRPYRAALGINKALDEIAGNKGIKYDPEVVDACLKLFAEGRFRFES